MKCKMTEVKEALPDIRQLPSYRYVALGKYGGHPFIVGNKASAFTVYGYLPMLASRPDNIFTEEMVEELAESKEPCPLLSLEDLSDPRNQQAFLLTWMDRNDMRIGQDVYLQYRANKYFELRKLKYDAYFGTPVLLSVTVRVMWEKCGWYVLDNVYIRCLQKALGEQDTTVLDGFVLLVNHLDVVGQKSIYAPARYNERSPGPYRIEWRCVPEYIYTRSSDKLCYPENEFLIQAVPLLKEYRDLSPVLERAKAREQDWLSQEKKVGYKHPQIPVKEDAKEE